MLSIGILKRNIKGFSLRLCLALLLSLGASTFAKTPLGQEKIASLRESIQKKPSQWKPRYTLAKHFASIKKWKDTSDLLTPVIENLPQKGLLLLIKAQKELKDYSSMEPVVASLRSQKRLSLKAKVEVLEASMMVLRETEEKSYAVGQASDLETAAKGEDTKKEDSKKDKATESSAKTAGKGPNTPQNTLRQPIDNQKAQKETAPVVTYASSPKIDEVAMFFKGALKDHPRSLKLNDLYLKFLEEFIDHYAFEGLFVLDALAKERKLRARHFSKLCQYSTKAGYGKRAVESCEMALKKDPKNVQNSLLLGQAYAISGNNKKSSRVLASVVKNHEGSASALKASAEHFLQKKNYPEAYKLFSKATQTKEVDPGVYLGLAKTAMELKKFDIALKAFQTHCQLTHSLNQDFRRASGLLAKRPEIQAQFRKVMRVCNK